MSEADQDVSRRYWKAAISALPTAEKRDAAWEFYLDKFAGTSAGDTSQRSHSFAGKPMARSC